MAGELFYVKQNDTQPSILEVLLLGGTIIDLTGCQVEFHLRLSGSAGIAKVSAAAVIVDAASGIVRYDWFAADTDTIGDYVREWEITYPGGRILTVPNDIEGYPVKITDDLA